MQTVTPTSGTNHEPKIAVLVPTYRRPADLKRCLSAISKQTRLPDSIVVVCRADDKETHDVVLSMAISVAPTLVYVQSPGAVAALNAGLDRVSGDIVAITDDDAAPRPEWLVRIAGHFASDPDVGGVGGRDYVRGGLEPEQTKVGVVQWFGRVIGNHHLGIGAPRYVDVLKGANMSFRTTAIADVRFDERLRGSGAQFYNDSAFSFAIRRKGWRLLYDPAVCVDHYPAQRFDEDQRLRRTAVATRNSAYNETLTLLEQLPPTNQPIFMLWALLVGSRDLPGIIQCVRLALSGDPVWTQLPAVIHGRFNAIQSRYWHLITRSRVSK